MNASMQCCSAGKLVDLLIDVEYSGKTEDVICNKIANYDE